MAILKIARMGHPVLREPARPVPDPAAPEIERLAADMIETMYDAPGVGLAAPQVHVPYRMVVFHVPQGRTGAEDGTGNVDVTVLINPEIIPLDDETENGFEGCLSLPGMTGNVARCKKIKYRGFGLDGELIEREASGFHARVVQHECDHLDGILYPQRMDDLSTFGFVDEMKKAYAQEDE